MANWQFAPMPVSLLRRKPAGRDMAANLFCALYWTSTGKRYFSTAGGW
jgi:hypothetical protein